MGYRVPSITAPLGKDSMILNRQPSRGDLLSGEPVVGTEVHTVYVGTVLQQECFRMGVETNIAGDCVSCQFTSTGSDLLYYATPYGQVVMSYSADYWLHAVCRCDCPNHKTVNASWPGYPALPEGNFIDSYEVRLLLIVSLVFHDCSTLLLAIATAASPVPLNMPAVTWGPCLVCA